jgi:hypothetical protein
MSTKSNVFMNWTGVTVVYGASPTTITLTEVTDIQVVDSDILEMWQADGHKFPTLCIAADANRGLTIHGGDCYKLAAMPRNTPCTINATLRDAANGAGTGALVLALSNAVLSESNFSGQTNKFAGGSATFMAFSSDGSTDPLAISQTA